MTQASPETRSFSVRARYGGGRTPQVIEEASFEAAALAFVEDWPHPAAGEAALSILVQDLGSGREHCYRIHLDTGAAEPCG
jgi:hypothetical protein